MRETGARLRVDFTGTDLELKDGRVDGHCAVALEDAGDDLERLLADRHLERPIVACALELAGL